MKAQNCAGHYARTVEHTSCRDNPPRAATPDPNEFHFLGVRLYRGTEYKWHQSSVREQMPDPPFTPVLEFGVSLPCWQAAALSACLPAHWLLRRRRRQIGRRRADLGHCVGCGYDLRASTGRCPECGAIP